jgi:hypothetical protein
VALTEADWLNCDKVTIDVLNWLHRRYRGSDRKFYLAGAAAARHIAHQLTGPRYRKLIELVEQFADGLADGEDLARQQDDAEAELHERMGDLQRNGLSMLQAHKRLAAEFAATRAAMPEGFAAFCSALADAARAGKRSEMWGWQAKMLRDVFGNPFRPVKLDPAWRSRNVVDLARGIYGDRAFDRMPILADSLEESGCTSVTILEHCRRGPVHVRGCWVVDLLLEKS